MDPIATNLEICFAFYKLDRAGRLGVLEGYAARYIHGTSFAEPADLVQEALTRALEGSRQWPLRASFVVFMCLAMRSIAESDRNRNGQELSRSLSIDDEDASSGIVPKAPSLSPEEMLGLMQQLRAAAEAVNLARKSLGEDDAPANNVIDGLLQGMAPREIREQWTMSARTFDSARHRAARTLRDATDRVLSERNARGAARNSASAQCGGNPEQVDQTLNISSRTPKPRPARRKM